ncbi:MAG: hypothetical protein ACE5HX_06695 [bacterium]
MRSYIIWLPILKIDSRKLAIRRTKLFKDKRITYFWDGRGITGDIWQQQLGLTAVAWDVYLLYNAQASWGKEPGKPDFWMHQLSIAKDLATYLDEPTLELKTKELLQHIRR